MSSSPKRIASLAPSNTDIALALGLGDELVAVDDWSDLPGDGTSSVVRLGGDITIDLARLKESRPDLVLCSLSVPGMERIVDGVRDLGLDHIILDPERWEDIHKSIFAIGLATGKEEEALALAEKMRREAEEVTRAALRVGEIPRVYLEWWPSPRITPGRRSWVTDMIEMAGGRNVFADIDARSSPVVDDEVLARDPEVILACWCGAMEKRMSVEEVRGRKGWKACVAVRDERIHLVPERVFGRPGPALAEGLKMLLPLVHPELRQELSHAPLLVAR